MSSQKCRSPTVLGIVTPQLDVGTCSSSKPLTRMICAHMGNAVAVLLNNCTFDVFLQTMAIDFRSLQICRMKVAYASNSPLQ